MLKMRVKKKWKMYSSYFFPLVARSLKTSLVIVLLIIVVLKSLLPDEIEGKFSYDTYSREWSEKKSDLTQFVLIMSRAISKGVFNLMIAILAIFACQLYLNDRIYTY